MASRHILRHDRDPSSSDGSQYTSSRSCSISSSSSSCSLSASFSDAADEDDTDTDIDGDPAPLLDHANRAHSLPRARSHPHSQPQPTPHPLLQPQRHQQPHLWHTPLPPSPPLTPPALQRRTVTFALPPPPLCTSRSGYVESAHERACPGSPSACLAAHAGLPSPQPDAVSFSFPTTTTTIVKTCGEDGGKCRTSSGRRHRRRRRSRRGGASCGREWDAARESVRFLFDGETDFVDAPY